MCGKVRFETTATNNNTTMLMFVSLGGTRLVFPRALCFSQGSGFSVVVS